jgi:hypothetical protein
MNFFMAILSSLLQTGGSVARHKETSDFMKKSLVDVCGLVSLSILASAQASTTSYGTCSPALVSTSRLRTEHSDETLSAESFVALASASADHAGRLLQLRGY